jgi:hypothetical protein
MSKVVSNQACILPKCAIKVNDFQVKIVVYIDSNFMPISMPLSALGNGVSWPSHVTPGQRI